MPINVTCPKCQAVVSVDTIAKPEEYLEIKETDCPICGHQFKMKFVNFFDEQMN